ncbi:hypothetical protein MAR_013767 [Mya arenaria]|uniref:Uncharacterized protein n=1 Tax=Mya arenaria TaxID=6604 RepID=A0ABY7G0T6_MYAAR|nr:hypothetical protein MAR_013767 [Mya arenaria]
MVLKFDTRMVPGSTFFPVVPPSSITQHRTLIQPMSLYAKVNEIAWPKEHSTENIDVGDDGSVCVTSNDEFGSVHEDVILTEPGTTTTLEECEIPGYDIVDKTVLKSDMLENPKGASSQFVPSNKPGPGILRNTDQVRAKESRSGNFPPRTVQIHSPNASQSSSISTGSSSKHSLLEKHIPSTGYSESGMTNSETFFRRNVRPVPIGQDNLDNRMSELDGFNSVRQALMKTSNFIKDIDHLLDTK